MELFEEQERTPQLLSGLLEVWEASVRTSHRFLTEPEIQRIQGYVPQALAEVPCLITAGEGPERPAAFMGIQGRRLEMLFLAPEVWGTGLGRRLLAYGIRRHGVRELTVYEQNPRAVGFYAHMGFETYRRTDRDEEGGLYPLLYMRLREQG